MKIYIRSGLWSCFFLVNTIAASFTNMGFDEGKLPFLLPGWSTDNPVAFNHSLSFGGVSAVLNTDFRDTHFGLNAPAPVVGNFALGIWPIPSPAIPFILKQTGDIPADAQSLQFLYRYEGISPYLGLRVFVGGMEELLNFIGTQPTDNPAAPTARYYAVDVSPFAGKTTELRFEFRSYGYDDFSGAPRIPFDLPNAQSHVLDDLKFSALPASVPEPGTYALFGLGFAALAVHLRRPRP